MKTILITGGAGFIGSALVRMLVHRAWVERVQAGTYRGERLGLGVMS